MQTPEEMKMAIEFAGMQAENQRCACAGEPPKYSEADFLALREKHGLVPLTEKLSESEINFVISYRIGNMPPEDSARPGNYGVVGLDGETTKYTDKELDAMVPTTPEYQPDDICNLETGEWCRNPLKPYPEPEDECFTGDDDGGAYAQQQAELEQLTLEDQLAELGKPVPE